MRERETPASRIVAVPRNSGLWFESPGAARVSSCGTVLCRSFSLISLLLAIGCAEHSVLDVLGPEHRAVLNVHLDGGVRSTLPEGATFIKEGEKVTYSFSAEESWADLAVWINGEVAPASGSFEARDTVTILASALPEPAPIPQQVSALVNKRREVEQASSAEDFLQKAEEYIRGLEGSGVLDSPEELERFRTVAFEPRSGYEQLALLNSVLAGHRILVRDGHLVGIGGQAGQAALASFGGSDTWIPVFVNGIWTSPLDAIENLVSLSKTLKGQGFEGGVELWYNPTRSEEDFEKLGMVGCLLALNEDLSAMGMVRQFLSCLPGAYQFDLVEAGLQALAAKLNAPPTDNDADKFYRLLKTSLANSSHLQFLTHSQGNLILQEALKLAKGKADLPTNCFGVTGVAEPVSGSNYWALSDGRYRPVVAEKDAILVLGMNGASQIRTELYLEMSDKLKEIEVKWYDFILFGRWIDKQLAKLIIEQRYSFKIHSWSSYLGDQATREAIKSALEGNVGAVRTLHECSSPDIGQIIPIGDGRPGKDFGVNGGSFTLSVAPLDPQGTLQLRGLGLNSFSFEGVRAIPLSQAEPISGIAVATEVVAEERTGDPLDLMMVFDASGSMNTNDPKRLSLAAGRDLLNYLDPGDRVGVMAFASSVSLRQPLTTDRQAVKNAISSVSFGGNTALYKAVIDASNLLAGATVPTLVVLSDGGNNVAPSNRSWAVNAALGIGASVYGIGLGTGSSVDNIRALAGETGGVYANAANASALQAVYDAIALGVGQGRLIVEGRGRFDRQLPPGTYRVEGDLITTVGTRSFTTPWKFEVTMK